MAALTTVDDYISASRVLLQDTVEEFRYPDADLVLALNLAFIEAKRVRPDMFLTTVLPNYNDGDGAQVVPIDEQYRSAFLFYIVGWAQLRDEEGTQDARAGEFVKRFTMHLVGLA